MELLPSKSWKHEFARSTEAERYREIVRRNKQDEQRRQKDKDDKEERGREDDLEDLAFAVMASQSDIDMYLVTTAHYQEATYEAILQNERLLIDVRRERDKLFERAHVMDDGRRVFESEDGIRVFDEHGIELDPSEITADEIDDRRPKHEQVVALSQREAELVEEQTELLEYQQKVDEARERLEAGEISQKDFDAMKQDLAEAMPERVRDNLPDEYKPEWNREQTDELAVHAAPMSRPGPVPGS